MKHIVLFFFSCCILSVSAQKLRESGDGYTLKVSIDKKSPVYQVNDTVYWTVSLTKEGEPVNHETVQWIKSKDYYTPTKTTEKVVIKEGKAVVAATLDEPGFLHCRFNFKTPEKTVLSALFGVAFDPLEIKPSYPAPEDFDPYWSEQKKQQDKQALDLKMTAVQTRSPEIEVFDVQAHSLLGNFSAYMARPAGAKQNSLPAMILFHGAGVASSRLNEVVRWAKEGVCVIDFNVHGLPNGQPSEFYRELNAGSFKQYYLKGIENKDSLFFKAMVMRVLRAIDIITQQPEWDGKNLIAFGRSQGGGQAVMAAGLDPRINLICAEVPALCDHTGNVAGRVNGWPKLLGNTGTYDRAALEVVPYFDAVNFAKRTKAKAYVTVGFIDLSCPPTSVYAMYNQLKGEKKILDIYDKGHVASPEGWEFVCDGVKDFLSLIKNKQIQ
jgi:cephalosporin-C deacetylase-like acetyl esterase